MNENTKLDDFFNTIIETWKDRETIAKDDTYMDWLVGFLKTNNGYVDNYCDTLSIKFRNEEDNNQLRRLDTFFMAVSYYAQINYIGSDDWDTTYLINFKNNIYELQLTTGQGSYTSFEDLGKTLNDFKDTDTLQSIIDFEDIKNGKTTDRTIKINKKKQELEEYIASLLDEGIPSNTITDTINVVLTRKKE